MQPAPSISAAAELVKTGGIIAIVRGDFEPSRLLEIATALHNSGISLLEVTLNSRNALELIAMLQSSLGAKLLIGAGTVLSATAAREAMAAGAGFLVSPGLDSATVKTAQAADILHLPGVFSPSEVQQALALGSAMLKLFPADSAGPGYLKALRAPFNRADFVATGGISAANIAAWRAAGVVAVAAGSTLIDPRLTTDAIAARASAMCAAWQQGATA